MTLGCPLSAHKLPDHPLITLVKQLVWTHLHALRKYWVAEKILDDLQPVSVI